MDLFDQIADQMAALRKDAERYRWLRSEDETGRVAEFWKMACLDYALTLEPLDSAIDAAMAKERVHERERELTAEVERLRAFAANIRDSTAVGSWMHLAAVQAVGPGALKDAAAPVVAPISAHSLGYTGDGYDVLTMSAGSPRPPKWVTDGER